MTRKHYLILVMFTFVLIGTTIFVLFSGSQGRQTDNDVTAEEQVTIQDEAELDDTTTGEQATGDLGSVNKEEKNTLTNKLRLPFENDVYYINYRLGGRSGNELTVYIFDKTNGGNITGPVQQQALQYIRDRGVDPASITIQYRAAP